MTAVKITKHYFSGLSHVQDAAPGGLSSILRNLAIDNARNAVSALSLSNVTDNTTGTAAKFLTVTGIIAPSGVYNATSSGGVQTAAFNTSLGKIRSALASWAKTVNKVGAKLGLPIISTVEGIAVYNTILAQDLTATTASGASAVNYSSFVGSTSVVITNLHSLFLGFNAVLKAFGLDPIPKPFAPSAPSPSTLYLAGNNVNMIAIPAVVSDATGASSVSLADGTAFLAAMANNFATLAAFWNIALNFSGSGVTALTDSTGGTADTINPLTLAPVVATPLAGHVDASGDSAQSAALNTLFATYQNAFSSIQALINSYNNYEGVPAVSDPSGGTVSTTLAAETIAPSAGSAGTFATAVFTQNSTNNLLATDTFQVGNSTFTIVATIGTTAGNVLKGANWAATLTNIVGALAASISGSGATANYIPLATPANVSGVVGSTTATFTSLVEGTAGNALASVYTASGTSGGSFGGSVFSGGAAATAASLASINVSLNVIEDNIAMLGAQISEMLINTGNEPFVDTSGGSILSTLQAIPVTTTADNLTLPVGAANADVIVCLTAIRNNMSTMAAALATVISDTTFVAPISVVAG